MLSLLFLLLSVDGILMGLQKLDVEFARVGSIKKVAPPILSSMIHMGTSASGSNSQQESEKTALVDLRARLAEMDSNRDPDAPPCDPVNRWSARRRDGDCLPADGSGWSIQCAV